MLHLTLKFIHQSDEFVCEIQYDPGDYLQVDCASKNGQKLSESEIAEFEKVHFNHIVQLANERAGEIIEARYGGQG